MNLAIPRSLSLMIVCGFVTGLVYSTSSHLTARSQVLIAGGVHIGTFCNVPIFSHKDQIDLNASQLRMTQDLDITWSKCWIEINYTKPLDPLNALDKFMIGSPAGLFIGWLIARRRMIFMFFGLLFFSFVGGTAGLMVADFLFMENEVVRTETQFDIELRVRTDVAIVGILIGMAATSVTALWLRRISFLPEASNKISDEAQACSV